RDRRQFDGGYVHNGPRQVPERKLVLSSRYHGVKPPLCPKRKAAVKGLLLRFGEPALNVPRQHRDMTTAFRQVIAQRREALRDHSTGFVQQLVRQLRVDERTD